MKAIIAGLPIALSRMSLFEFIFKIVNKLILLIVNRIREKLVSFELLYTKMRQKCHNKLNISCVRYENSQKMLAKEDLEKKLKS